MAGSRASPCVKMTCPTPTVPTRSANGRPSNTSAPSANCGAGDGGLRIFNAYGPGQSLPVSHAPVPRFLEEALAGGSLVVFGDGRQTRDYIYVDDVIDALIGAATTTGLGHAVINIGNGRETSVNELIAQIERATGRHANVIHNPEKQGGVPQLAADVGRARQLLGFEPKIDLETGLRLTLDQDARFGRAKA